MTSNGRQTQKRRGVVLIIVLAMLGLFAAIAVAFTLVATSESLGARNYKRSFSILPNTSTGTSASVAADALYRFAITQLLYDTDLQNSALRGHSLLRDMYGGPNADPRHINKATLPVNPLAEYAAADPSTYYRGVYNGTGLFTPRDLANNYIQNTPDAALNISGAVPTTVGTIENSEVAYFLGRIRPINPLDYTASSGYQGIPPATQFLDPLFPLNLQIFQTAAGSPGPGRAATPTVGGGQAQAPEEYWVGVVRHYFGYDEDYDAPDHNNMFLALERADGQILLPSFHRPYLVRQLEQAGVFTAGHPARTPSADPVSGGNTLYSAWMDRNNGRRVIFRPRELEYSREVLKDGVASTKWKDPRDVDGSGYVGDCPDELDVDTDGDGLKDAIWMDLGYGAVTASSLGLPGSGKVKPLYAFKIIDLDGKVNINTAGKYLKGTAGMPNRPELHVSHLGASPTEVNPKHLMLISDADVDTAGSTQPDWNNPQEYERLLIGNLARRARGKWTNSALSDAQLFSGGTPQYTLQRAGVIGDADTIPNPTNLQLHRGKSPIQYQDSAVASSSAGPLDWLGAGKVYSPFEHNAAQQHLALFTSAQYPLRSVRSVGYNQAGSGVASLSPNTTLGYVDESEEMQLYQANADDTPFTADELERLLRIFDIDATSLSTRLEAVMNWILTPEAYPGSRSSPPQQATNQQKSAWRQREFARRRIRKMMTHASWDLTRYNMPPMLPAATAYAEDESRVLASTANVRHNGRLAYRTGSTIPDDLGLSTTTNNNFGNRYPREVALGQRYDLNRTLELYENNPTLADQQRSDMAEQLYVLLWFTVRPDQLSSFSDGTDNLSVSRLLAQIAVNIVDYIDPDSVMTTMVFDENLSDGGWSASASDPTRRVFGFELPELVINEAVAVSATIKNTSDDWVRLWVELRNPAPAETSNPVGGANIALPPVQLIRNNYSVFQIQIKDATNTISPVKFRPSESVATAPYAEAQTAVAGDKFSATDGFFLVGPATPTATDTNNETDQTIAGWAQTNNNYTTDELVYKHLAGRPTKVQLNLQRLRNPYAANDANLNPLVTIDYLDLTLNNGLYYYTYPTNQQTSWASMERKEPWVGQGSRQLQFSAIANSLNYGQYLGFPPLNVASKTPLWGSRPDGSAYVDPLNYDQPGFDLASTGGSANGNSMKQRNSLDRQAYLSFPFPNRPLATPLELLSLRLYGVEYVDDGTGIDWRLRFTNDYEMALPAPTSWGSTNAPPGVYRSRLVPWFDDLRTPTADHPARNVADATYQLLTNLKSVPDLYRFFEFIDCHSRMRDAAVQDASLQRKHRVAGKINLNTITDEEVFRALIDEPEAMPAQRFTGSFGGGWTATSPLRLPPNYTIDGGRILLFQSLLNSPAGGSDSLFGVNGYAFGGGVLGNWTSTAKQWPGVDRDSSTDSVLPGRDPANQVHSELYRMFLLSRAGRDGLLGTGDDKPFRGFGAGRLSDTILRRRNHLDLDQPEDRVFDPLNGARGEFIAINGGAPLTTYPAIGNWAPRLFDPNPDPYSQTGVAARVDLARSPSVYPALTNAGGDSGQAVQHWMLEEKRNKILAKIAGNTTTRSHVFAVWMTIGFFDVDDESVTPELIGTEAGLATGNVQRRRCFFIVDRSLADHYDGPDGSPNGPALKDINMLVLPGKVRFIE